MKEKLDISKLTKKEILLMGIAYKDQCFWTLEQLKEEVEIAYVENDSSALKILRRLISNLQVRALALQGAFPDDGLDDIIKEISQ